MLRLIVDPVSTSPAEIARNSHTLALQRLQVIGQNTIAEKLGLSESTISRLVSENLQRTFDVLAHLDLRVIETGYVAVEECHFRSMCSLLARLFDDQEKLIGMVRR